MVYNDAKRANLFASGAQAQAGKTGNDLKAFAQARRECADMSLAYQAFLGAVLFHEFAHCFVFYLGMDGNPDTPNDVNGSPLMIGGAESGEWLETQVLGGVVMMKVSFAELCNDER